MSQDTLSIRNKIKSEITKSDWTLTDIVKEMNRLHPTEQPTTPQNISIGPHSVNVARYASLIRVQSTTNCDAQLTKSIFKTRSRACLKNAFREMCFTLGGEFIPNL